MKVWFLVFTLALSGCATLGSVPSDGQASAERAWQTHRSAVSRLGTFTLDGRAAQSGATPFKAQLRWEQQADGAFALRLSGPFGLGAVNVAGTPRAVRISSREGSVEPVEPQAWLRQQLGVEIPLAQLAWWLRGLPSPETDAALEVLASGEVLRLAQAGWTLHYPEYQDQIGQRLPRRIEAEQGAVKLKLVADTWHASP